MINMIKLGYTPNTCCWMHKRGEALGLLAMFALLLETSPRRINDGLALKRVQALFGYTTVVAMGNPWKLLTTYIARLSTS